MSVSFINIHTHHPQQTGTVAVLNVILRKDSITDIPEKGYFSCGIHPWYLDHKADKKRLENIIRVTVQDKRCLALGEAGLDKSIETPLSLQQDIFIMQAKLAEQLEKPLIIHCVKAYGELLAIRKELKARQPWIFHGFSSSPAMAEQLMQHGCMVSLGKALLNEKSKARNVFSTLEPDQFFLETDDEDFPVDELYTFAAEFKGISLVELKKAIWEKFCTVFILNQPLNT